VVELEVERVIPDAVSEAYVVVLREKNGRKLLPIWIRRLEAESIAEAIQHVQHKRPLTHDLCKSIIVTMGGTLQAVHITRVQDDTYYAQLVVKMTNDAALVHIDSRPSDSIAIAVRMNAPILADESLLTAVDVGDGAGPTIAFSTGAPTEPGAELSVEQLKAHLQKLRPEDFGKFSP
jgi:bifunctional DNase/RNase